MCVFQLFYSLLGKKHDSLTVSFQYSFQKEDDFFQYLEITWRKNIFFPNIGKKVFFPIFVHLTKNHY